MNKTDKKTVLSLFSGCGGMDIGFEGGFSCFAKSIDKQLHPDWIEKESNGFVLLSKTGFEVIFANDIRPSVKTVWVSYFRNRYNDAEKRYVLGSIVDLVKQAKAGKKVFSDMVDVVIGGFPCQDFSTAGKRLGFHSEKSHTGKYISIDEPTIENRGHLYQCYSVKPNFDKIGVRLFFLSKN